MVKTNDDIWWATLCLAMEASENASHFNPSECARYENVANKARIALRDLYHHDLDDAFKAAKERFEFLLEQED